MMAAMPFREAAFSPVGAAGRRVLEEELELLRELPERLLEDELELLCELLESLLLEEERELPERLPLELLAVLVSLLGVDVVRG